MAGQTFKGRGDYAQAIRVVNSGLDSAGAVYGGNPIKIALEMKGGGWTQAKVTRLADVLKSKGFGMFGPRVNVHAVSVTQVQYAKVAGFPNRGYVALGTVLPS